MKTHFKTEITPNIIANFILMHSLLHPMSIYELLPPS